MRRAKNLALLLAVAASACAADLSLGTAASGPGQPVNLSVTLRTLGANMSGLQFDLSYDKTALGISVVAGSAAEAAGKQVFLGDLPGGKRVLIIGFNQNLMGDGGVANLTITVGASVPSGSYPLALSNSGGTDPSGQPVSILANSGAVVVINANPPVWSGGIAVFRASGGVGVWVLDNGNNVYDAGDKFRYFGLAGDQAVAGDWTGTGQTRLGVFRNGLWYLDLNNNGQWDGAAGGDGVFAFGLPGDVAVVGDWNGDGRTKLGVFRCPQPGAGACTWVLDMAGKFYYDPATAKGVSYGLPGDTPVVNNWNGTSNVDQIGIYRPMPNGFGLWIVDSDGSGAWEPSDAAFWYGLAADIPVVGNWNNGTRKRIGVFRNGLWILDTNGNNAYDATDGVGWFGLPGDQPVVGNWSVQ